MRPALTLFGIVVLVAASMWFAGMVAIAALLFLLRTATYADDLSGACCLAMLLLSLAGLSRLQRWRG